MGAVTTALVEGITTIATEGLTAIGSVVPVALPIFGAVVVIGIGLKVLKKVTGR